MNEIKLISSPINLNERINFFILEWRVGWVKWELMEWLIASFIEELHSSNYGVNSYRFWPQSTPINSIPFTQLNSINYFLISFQSLHLFPLQWKGSGIKVKKWKGRVSGSGKLVEQWNKIYFIEWSKQRQLQRAIPN